MDEEDRVAYTGDTFPNASFQLSDVTGVLTTLPTASSIVVHWIGKLGAFSGAGAAINPPVDDPDPNSTLVFNCSYTFGPADTATPDLYSPYVVVTWETGRIQTFAIGNGLVVKAMTADVS